MNKSKKIVRERVITYILVFVVLMLFYVWKMNSTWVGNKQIHTLMELTATFRALFVGVFAFICYYIKRETLLIFIGQVLFMPFSFQLFDFRFDFAHILKKLSYTFVLIGLLFTMYSLFFRSEKRGHI